MPLGEQKTVALEDPLIMTLTCIFTVKERTSYFCLFFVSYHSDRRLTSSGNVTSKNHTIDILFVILLHHPFHFIFSSNASSWCWHITGYRPTQLHPSKQRSYVPRYSVTRAITVIFDLFPLHRYRLSNPYRYRYLETPTRSIRVLITGNAFIMPLFEVTRNVSA